jgi:hypothetical protein
VLNGKAPKYLSELLSSYNPGRILGSSTKNLLHKPRFNLKTFGSSSFAVASKRQVSIFYKTNQ